MKRVLSLVLALVLVLGMIPTFAADMTAGQHLFEHEFIAGDGMGNLNEDQLLTREQLAKLILELNGSKEEAEALTLPPSFTDSAKISAWARPYVAYAQIEGLMVGFTDGSFRPMEGVTGQQLAAVLTRALGYEFEWATVIADAADLGIEVPAVAKLTRGEAFEAMWVTVNTAPDGEELALGVLLGKLEDPTPKPVALAVESVSTDNLKTILVKFNEEVDATTVNATNIKVTNGTPTLLADKMTVAVVMNPVIAQSATVTVAVSNVKSVDGDTVATGSFPIVVTDTKVPEVVGASAVNAKKIDVFFSEPINFTSAAFAVLNDVKIDNVPVIAQAASDATTNKVTFTLPSALTAGTHTISIANMADYATYKAVTKSFEFTVVEDKAAPTLVSAEATTKSEIKLTFSEELNAVGTVSVGTAGANQNLVPVLVSGNVYKITLGTALDLSAVVEVKLSYVGQSDVIGNAITTAQTYTFKVADDTTLPAVTASVSATNELTLTFTKSMDLTVGAIQVKTSAATTNLVPAGGTASSNNTVIKFTAAAAGLNNLNPENVTVKITGMKDASIRMNLLPETTLTLAVNDSKVPTVQANYFRQAGATAAADTVTIYFSEAMDTATLNNLSNYNHATFGVLSSYAGTSVKSVAADGKSVTLTVNNIFATGGNITVYSLKDIAGNFVASTVVSPLASTALTVGTVEMTAVNKIKVTFSTALLTVDPSALKVVLAAGGADEAVFISAVLDTEDTTNKTAIFTTNKNLSTDASLYNIKENNAAALTNIYGVAMTAPGATAITDKVAPTVTLANVVAGSTLTLNFSEAMEVNNFGMFADGGDLADLDATGHTIADVTPQFIVFVNDVAVAVTSYIAPDADTVTITLAAPVTAGKVVKVQYTNSPTATINLRDVANNNVANFTLTDTVE